MGRRKEPIDLITAKNKTHLTRAEIEERKSSEIDTSAIADFEVPEHLSEDDRKLFMKYAVPLSKIGIFTELDVDMLERYIHAYRMYTLSTSRLYKAMKENDLKTMRAYQKAQSTAFTQCQNCARELGLSISSRCKLNVPKTDDDKEEDFSAYFS